MPNRGRSVSADTAERVHTLIRQGKPPVEVRRATGVSLPYVYRQFRALNVPLPMERAGLGRTLSSTQKQYIREHIEDGANEIANELAASTAVVRGYMLDLAIEALLTEVTEVDVIARRLGISQQRVRQGLQHMGYEPELKWVKLIKED